MKISEIIKKLNEKLDESQKIIESDKEISYQAEAEAHYNLDAKQKYLFDLTLQAVKVASKSPDSELLNELLNLTGLKKEDVVNKYDFGIVTSVRKASENFDYTKIEEYFVQNEDKSLKPIANELEKVVAPGIADAKEKNAGFDKRFVDKVHNNIPQELKENKEITDAIKFIDENYVNPISSYKLMEADIVEKIVDYKDKEKYFVGVPEELQNIDKPGFAKYPYNENAVQSEDAPRKESEYIYDFENPGMIENVAFVNNTEGLKELKKQEILLSDENKQYLKSMFNAFKEMGLYKKNAEISEDAKKFAFQNLIKANDSFQFTYQDFPKQNYYDDGKNVHLTDEEFKEKLNNHYKKIPKQVEKFKKEYNNIETLYKMMDEHESKTTTGSPTSQFYMSQNNKTTASGNIQSIPQSLKQDYEKMAKLNSIFAIYEFIVDNDLDVDSFLEKPLHTLSETAEKKKTAFDAFFVDKQRFFEKTKNDITMQDTMKRELGENPTQKEIDAWLENKYFENNLNKLSSTSLMNFTRERDVFTSNSNDVVDALMNIETGKTKEHNLFVGEKAKKTYLNAPYNASVFKASQYFADIEIFQRLAIVDEADVPGYFEKMAKTGYDFNTLKKYDDPFNVDEYLFDQNHQTRFDVTAHKLKTLMLNLPEGKELSAISQIYEGMNKLCFFREHDAYIYDENGKKTLDPNYQKIQKFVNDPVQYIKDINASLPENAPKINVTEDDLKVIGEVAKDKNTFVTPKDQKNYEKQLKNGLKTKERTFNSELTALSKQVKRLEDRIKKGGADIDANKERLASLKEQIANMSFEHAKSLKKDVMSGKITQSYFEKRMAQLKTLKPVKEKELPPMFAIDTFPKNYKKWFANSKYKDEVLSDSDKKMLYVSEKARAEIEKTHFIKNGAYCDHVNKNNREIEDSQGEQMFSQLKPNINIPVNVLRLADKSNFIKPNEVVNEKAEPQNIIENNVQSEKISIKLEEEVIENNQEVVIDEKEVKKEKEINPNEKKVDFN